LLKRLSFLHHVFSCLHQKSGWCSLVDSHLCLLFCSTGLHICLFASTMLSLLNISTNLFHSSIS
jgi:hypothetical protein